MKDITIRFKFFKELESKYLSHLDVLKIMSRAIARSNIKVSYSRGFNPKPRISFSNPIPLGVNSLAEYCDIRLNEDIDSQEFLRILNSNLPSGIQVTEAAKSIKKIPTLMSEISQILFEFKIMHIRKNTVCEKLISKLDTALKEYNQIYSSIYDYDIKIGDENIIFLKIFGYAKIFGDKNNKIFKFNGFFGFLNQFLEKQSLKIESSHKKEVFFFKDGKLITPLKVL